MDQMYMKEKPILPLLLSMALPMVISMFVNSLYNIIDSIFVAKISEDAMTALSLVYPVQNLINSIAVGFGVGINAVIAMFLGAGKAKEADKPATQGLFLNVIHGILLTIVGLMIMPSFLAMFTNDQTVIGMGLQYSTIALMFSTIIMASISFEKIFQAVGNMVITMIALMTGCIVNIVLDPLLIFGIGFFPKLGIQGAALATGIGQSSTLILYLIVYILRPIHVKIDRNSSNFKYGTAIFLSICFKCDLSIIFTNICCCTWCLLQITNILISNSKWNDPGNASDHEL